MKQFDDNLAVNYPRPMGVPTYNVPLPTLEHWRDQMADRVARLCAEPAGASVEGFLYVPKDGLSAEKRAARVRGRLLCSLLRAIDETNRAICARIAPDFRPSPSVGFSDRVMGGLPSEAA